MMFFAVDITSQYEMIKATKKMHIVGVIVKANHDGNYEYKMMLCLWIF